MRASGFFAVAAAVAMAVPAVAQAPPVPPEGGRGRLQADRIRYDARNRVFEARGNVRLQVGETTITCQVLVYHVLTRVAWAEGAVHVRQPDVELLAPSVRYEVGPQVTTAEGGVEVVQEGTRLRARNLRFLHRERVAFAEGEVRLLNDRWTLDGERLRADLQNRTAEVQGPARWVRKGGPPPPGREGDRILAALSKEDTVLRADRRLTVDWARTEEATAEGNVRLEQVDKRARADEGTYSESKDRIELVGRVRLEQTSGQWLLRERLVRPPRSREEEEALSSPAVLEAQRVVVQLGSRNALAVGSVRVTQRGRSATGERAEYDDQEGRIVLSGRRVRLEREDGSWLEAQRVVVSLKEDTFEAYGAVDTTFTVRP